MTASKRRDLADLFAEEEQHLLGQSRTAIAAELAAWNALTPEQQAEAVTAQDERWQRLFAEVEALNEEEEDDEEEDDDEDE